MSVKRIYPPSGRQLLDGGLNTKFERSIIEDNESPDCLNVVFTNGAVETRQGAVQLNTTTVGAFQFDGFYTRRASTGAETMIVWAGGLMKTLAGTTFTTVASAQSVHTAGFRVTTAQYQNYMFIGNGSNIPYKWNGTEYTRHGVYPPTVTATVASNGVGALTASGQYQYKVTAVNSNLVESDVGPASTTFLISTTSGQNTVSAIPTFAVSYGVISRRLYRNANGGATFKLVTTIGDNTTTTFNDNVADTALGATAPTDNGVPPAYSIIIYHANRLWMNDANNPNRVYYTDIASGTASPFTVPSTNFFLVGDGTSDLVKGFGVYENSLIIYCEKSITLNYMVDATPGNWKQMKTRSPHGSSSPFGILSYKDKQLFPATQNGKFVGMSSLAGDVTEVTTSSLTFFTAGSELKTDRIETDMFSVQEGYLSNISGIVFKNKAYVSVTYGSSQTTNNRVYVYDFSYGDLSKDQEGSWVPWTGLSAQQFTVYAGNLYYASSDTSGLVFKLESGVYSDNGTAINSYFWTKEFSGEKSEYNFQKDFRYSNILIENAGAYYMNVGYRTDSDLGSGQTQQVTLNPGGSLWGSMRWGLDLWGGGSKQREYRQFLGQSRGKRIQLYFSNQNVAGQRFKIHGLNFLYNLKGYR